MTLSGLQPLTYDYGVQPGTPIASSEYVYLAPTTQYSSQASFAQYFNNGLATLQLMLQAPRTFSYAAIRTNSAGSSNYKCGLGIYHNDPATGKPTALIASSGELVCTGAAGLLEFAWSFSLAPGLYWLAQSWSMPAVTFNTMSTYIANGAVWPTQGFVHHWTTTGQYYLQGWYRSYTYSAGAMPDPWGTPDDSIPGPSGQNTNRQPIWMFR